VLVLVVWPPVFYACVGQHPSTACNTLQTYAHCLFSPQAYEGLQTADRLTEQYVFIPHKVKDVYLHHLLTSCILSLQEQQQQQQGGAAAAGSSGSSGLPAGLGGGARSAIIFVSTCKGCRVLDQVLRELGVPAASLHSGGWGDSGYFGFRIEGEEGGGRGGGRGGGVCLCVLREGGVLGVGLGQHQGQLDP